MKKKTVRTPSSSEWMWIETIKFEIVLTCFSTRKSFLVPFQLDGKWKLYMCHTITEIVCLFVCAQWSGLLEILIYYELLCPPAATKTNHLNIDIKLGRENLLSHNLCVIFNAYSLDLLCIWTVFKLYNHWNGLLHPRNLNVSKN